MKNHKSVKITDNSYYSFFISPDKTYLNLYSSKIESSGHDRSCVEGRE